MKLPKIPRGDGYGRDYQCVFPGLNENLAAADGEIAAMENMTGDHYPLLSPRGPRYRKGVVKNPQGLGALEKLCWAADGKFYYNGEEKGELTLPGDKRFYALNKWLCIWPDKLFYNTETDVFGSLEAHVTVDGDMWHAAFASMTAPESGISSEANCLVVGGKSLGGIFEPGQAVTVSGCTLHPENNRTLVIREVSGSSLFFYDNSFTLEETRTYTVPQEGLAAGYWNYTVDGYNYFFELPEDLAYGDTVLWRNDETVTAVSGGTETPLHWEFGAGGNGWIEFGESVFSSYNEPGPVTVSRVVPDLEHICQCDNRLWGTVGDEIRCCALGDPRVWNNFDGTATSCWSVEVGSGEPFTGAFTYGGYPLLFQENRLYRVYGTKPQNYQLLETETLGCEKGSEKSFAVVGQTLYYKSRAGICAYGGGVPALVDEALGSNRRQDAIGGTDGRKYYVSLRQGEERSLYVYDTVLRLWHREDDAPVKDMVWCGGELHMLAETGELWLMGRVRSPEGEAEAPVESAVEFAPFAAGDMGKKSLRRLYFRVQTEGELALSVSYDGGEFEPVATVTAARRGLQTLQLIPRRCDAFTVKLEGTGDWKLWAMGREYYTGTVK